MLILNRLQVEALLDVDALIDALASAMADLSAGRASVPDRVAALVPEHEGFLVAMPGFVPSAKVLMSKLVSLFPHNAGTGLPTHQAVIVAFDPDTGQPVALRGPTWTAPALRRSYRATGEPGAETRSALQSLHGSRGTRNPIARADVRRV